MAEPQGQNDQVGQENVSEPQLADAPLSPFSGDPEDLITGDGTDQLVTHYRARSRYIFDDRILAGSIAAKPGTQTKGFELIRVAIPTVQLAIDWTAHCKGAQPVKPAPYINDPNLTFLRMELDADNVDIEGDDEEAYFCSGTYYYAISDRSQATVAHSVPPYLDIQDGQILVMQASDFQGGLINAGWPNTAANSALNR